MPNEIIPPEIKNFTIQNPFLFAKVLEKNPALCRQILEQAFSLQIGELDYLGYENIFEDFSDYKDTRTDIYAHERNTTRFFTIEMQDNPDDYFGKKMRYYKAIMGKDSYQRMNTFADLYIVFVCPFDVFKEGHHLYSIKNRCLEDPSIVYDDGCYQIFLCSDSTEDDVNSEVRAFLDYVGCGSISTDFVRELDACVQQIKSDEIFQSDFKKYLATKSNL